ERVDYSQPDEAGHEKRLGHCKIFRFVATVHTTEIVHPRVSAHRILDQMLIRPIADNHHLEIGYASAYFLAGRHKKRQPLVRIHAATVQGHIPGPDTQSSTRRFNVGWPQTTQCL